MKVTNDEIESLTNRLHEWNAQITVLALKQEVTENLSTKLAQEIRELKAKHLEAIKQLADLELHRSGLYMWENIGCGG
jgi:chromosome segregation ATPase